MSNIRWLVPSAILIVLTAALPLKAKLSRTATEGRFDPTPQMSPADIRSMPATKRDGMTFIVADPIVPADSIPNSEGRGDGWGPLRLTDW